MSPSPLFFWNATGTATKPDVCYVDSSGLVKLAVPERESIALRGYLENRSQITSSSIARVEVHRTVAVHGTEPLTTAIALLATMFFVPVEDAILEAAIRISPAAIRTLDAIHLASALSLGDSLGSFVTYDRRMRDAAIALGLPVQSPE